MKNHRIIFRLGLLVLAVGILFSSLVACSGDNGNTEDTTDTTADEFPDDGRTKIVKNSVAMFTLVYPDNPSSTVREARDRLIKAIADATGVTPEMKSDYLKRGAIYDSSTPEILFGRTDYTETAEALKDLESDQFVIRKVNNKIVIAASQDVNLDAAVTYFCQSMTEQTLLTDSAGRKTLYLTEHTSDHIPAEEVKIAGTPISEFCIVYESERTGYSDVALLLKEMILDRFGVSLAVYKDVNREESGAEILVGKTNRTFSAQLYAEKDPKLMTYEVVLRQNKLQIVSGGPYSARECASYLRFMIPELTADGSYYATNLAPDTSALADGADLRVMTANVLAARWGEDATGDSANANTPTVAQRAEIFAMLLVNSKPDVIGMQEGDKKWSTVLPQYLELLKNEYGLEYTWLFPTLDGVENMTSILYRSDKYDLLESDTQTYSYWNVTKWKYHMRLMCWVELQSKTDPSQRFILLNTHWAHANEDASWIPASVSEEIALVNSLRTQYNVPIFCTGDFNSKTNSDEYNRFVSEAGVSELFKEAKSANVQVNECGGCGVVGQIRSGGNYIDHIFGTGSYTTLRYETLVDNRSQWLSDHSPHIADIKLN